VNLAETLGAGNTGSYTSQIACDQSWDGRRCAGSRRGSVHGTRNDAAVVTNPLSLAAVVSSAHGSRSAEFCSVLTTWEMWPSHSTWGSTVGLLIYTPDRTIRLRRPPILAERNRDSRAVRSGRIPAVEGILMRRNARGTKIHWVRARPLPHAVGSTLVRHRAGVPVKGRCPGG
jgi:hypothetical protein